MLGLLGKNLFLNLILFFINCWFYLFSIKNRLIIIDIDLQYLFIQLLLYNFIIHYQFLLFSKLLSLHFFLNLLFSQLFFHSFEQTFKISNVSLIQSFSFISFLFINFVLYFIYFELCNVLVLNAAWQFILIRFVQFCVFEWKFITNFFNILFLSFVLSFFGYKFLIIVVF